MIYLDADYIPEWFGCVAVYRDGLVKSPIWLQKDRCWIQQPSMYVFYSDPDLFEIIREQVTKEVQKANESD